jgi:hypothetical protein
MPDARETCRALWQIYQRETGRDEPHEAIGQRFRTFLAAGYSAHDLKVLIRWVKHRIGKGTLTDAALRPVRLLDLELAASHISDARAEIAAHAAREKRRAARLRARAEQPDESAPARELTTSAADRAELLQRARSAAAAGRQTDA